MGIKHLNKFLKEECKDSIKFISLSELSGKKIAVDISIYMYKYAADNTLIENMYLMLSVFRYYNIIPIFVFDGKPPAEKKELLQKRKENKLEAEDEYNTLKNKLDDNINIDDHEKQDIINSMDMLKRKFIHISKNHVNDVKNLIRAYGATYYDAPGEADELCALLVIKNKVWACLSEDMDMFVYGSTRVIRYLSLLNHTAVLYDQKGILDNLGVTQKELREICVLSGTDYNINHDCTIIGEEIQSENNTPNLYNTLKLFKKYHKKTTEQGFYNWLIQHTDYIKNYDLLIKIYQMFDIDADEIYYNHDNLKIFEKIKIVNGPIIYSEMKEILKTDGFIFPIKIKTL